MIRSPARKTGFVAIPNCSVLSLSLFSHDLPVTDLPHSRTMVLRPSRLAFEKAWLAYKGQVGGATR